MLLSPAKFNRFLRKIGQDVSWRKAFRCPCQNQYSGGPAPDCAQCAGAGMIWDAAACSYLGVSGQKFQRQWEGFGGYEKGDVVVSLPSDSPVYCAGEYDRIVFDNSSVVFTQVFRDSTQKMLIRPISIDRCFYLSGVNVVDIAIPQVDEDGAFVFPEPPPANTQFSVSGRRFPEYFVFTDLVQDRAHQGGDRLPRRVVLRSFDLYSRVVQT